MNNEFIRAYMSMGLGMIFFSVTGSILFWLLVRPVVLWYFKINKKIDLLTEIRDLLNKNQPGETPQNTYSGLSSDNPRNFGAETKIQQNVEPESIVEAEIKPKIDPDQARPTSSWNVDKPMLDNNDSRWVPTKNK